MAINTPDGIVLVVGCSHPGIESIVAEAAKINPRIHFIAGGFHLVVAQDPAIEKVATTLHDTYKVDYIAPGHCTGEPTFAALQRTFGDHYLYAGLGTTLDLGANPRAASDRRAPPESWTKATCAPTAPYSPKAMTSTRAAPRWGGSRRSSKRPGSMDARLACAPRSFVSVSARSPAGLTVRFPAGISDRRGTAVGRLPTN